MFGGLVCEGRSFPYFIREEVESIVNLTCLTQSCIDSTVESMGAILKLVYVYWVHKSASDKDETIIIDCL